MDICSDSFNVTLKLRSISKEYFSKMTSIFTNHDVSLDYVGEFMQNYAKEHFIKDLPRRLLIGSYFGKKNWTFYATIKMVLRTRTCGYLYLHSH